MRTHAFLFSALSAFCISTVASAATYTVNYLADYADPNPGDGICAGNGNTNFCTLRAAVQTANAHAGADTIVLPGGTYVLSLHGAGEDAAASGDLDITDSVTIQAQTAGVVPVIDGDGADRIFDISGPTANSIDVTLFGLRLTNGVAGPAGTTNDEIGGAIRAGTTSAISGLNNFNIDYCILDNNTASGGGAIYLNSANTLSMQYVLLTANRAHPLGAGSSVLG
ncbi:MAG: CSLREA domain-containing protein, partial [Rudaea sp.]